MELELVVTKEWRTQCATLAPEFEIRSVDVLGITQAVVNDFGARRGAIQQMDVSGDGTRTIAAMTPLTEMIGYATALRSITSGRGGFTMELDHYDRANDATHERFLGPEWKRLYHS